MPESAHNAITVMLQAAAAGNTKAAADVLPLVYQELRNLARSRMAKLPPGQTLQLTALVHEAYLRVVGRANNEWDNRGHFFAAAARAMRDILVDQARRKAAIKHGGGRSHVEADGSDLAIQAPSIHPGELIDLDEALRRLESDDPNKGQIVNFRYFAGLSVDETADVLGVSAATVKREWRYIKRWLYREVSGGNALLDPGSPGES